MQRTRSFTTSLPACAHPVPRIAHGDNTWNQSYHRHMHTCLPGAGCLAACGRAPRGVGRMCRTPHCGACEHRYARPLVVVP